MCFLWLAVQRGQAHQQKVERKGKIMSLQKVQPATLRTVKEKSFKNQVGFVICGLKLNEA